MNFVVVVHSFIFLWTFFRTFILLSDNFVDIPVDILVDVVDILLPLINVFDVVCCYHPFLCAYVFVISL